MLLDISRDTIRKAIKFEIYSTINIFRVVNNK